MLPPSLLPNQQSAFGTFPGENGKIAFVSGSGGGPLLDVFVMNPDGSGQTNITKKFGFDGDPDWSPDGEKIAFTSGRDNGGAEVYVMNADGSNPTRLTTDVTFGDFQPNWSPDGRKIAFVSNRDGNNEIYVMNADGSNPTRLTNFSNWDLFPSWSPDGRKIAFARDVGQFRFDIFVMNADGSGQTNISNNPAGDEKPDWSPDGRKIAFASNREGSDNWEIFVMNPDGSGQTRLTNNARFDHLPSWSPDGTKITFSTDTDVYVMNADGSGQTNISNNGRSSHPDWGTSTETQEDTTPPVLTVPDNKVVEATSEQGTEVTYTVTAEDNVDGNATLEEDGTTITQDDIGGDIDISCEPASGSTFPIGNTTVGCSATDEAGNTGTESFTVTVNAPPPPPPDPLTAEIISNGTIGFAPATFKFEANVTGGTEPYTYNWDFGDDSEGSQQQTVVHTFNEAGIYTVTLTVTDGNGQQANDTLQISVNERPPSPPPPIPRHVIDELISIIQNLDNVPQSLKADIIALLEEVSDILNDNNPNNDELACDKLGDFIVEVNTNERRGTLTPEQADDLGTQAEDIIRNNLDC